MRNGSVSTGAGGSVDVAGAGMGLDAVLIKIQSWGGAPSSNLVYNMPTDVV